MGQRRSKSPGSTSLSPPAPPASVLAGAASCLHCRCLLYDLTEQVSHRCPRLTPAEQQRALRLRATQANPGILWLPLPEWLDVLVVWLRELATLHRYHRDRL